MLYLGQSVSHTGQVTGNKKVPAVHIGFNTKNEYLLLALIDNKICEFSLQDGTKSLDVVREADPKSPTGWHIYYGALCKYIFINGKLKKPDETLLLNELNKTAKLITNHDKKINKND